MLPELTLHATASQSVHFPTLGDYGLLVLYLFYLILF